MLGISPVVLTLIGTVLTFSSIISALILYGLVRFRKRAKVTSTLPRCIPMKLINGRFYVLDASDEKWIYDSIDNAIEASKTLVSNKEVTPEEVHIFEVNVPLACNTWFSLIEKASKGGKART